MRPEHWRLSTEDSGDGLRASVERVEWLGDVTLVHCRLAGRDAANGGDSVSVKTTRQDVAALGAGTPVRLGAQPGDVMLFDGQGRALAA